MYLSCKTTFFIGFRTAGLSSACLVFNFDSGLLRTEELTLYLRRGKEFIQLPGVPGESSSGMFNCKADGEVSNIEK
jgi:hypothetical protein